MAPAIFVIPLLFTAAGGSAVGAGTCGADARGCADAPADTSALLQAGSAVRQRASHDQSEHDISESRSGEDARAQLLEIMRDTDADKDGKLTREELLAKVPDLHAERAVAMLERHFEAVDGDRDGAISLQELPALLQASNAEQEDGEEGVESEEGDDIGDGMDNNEAASGLPSGDCWYKCGNKGGYCAWCGTGACCRKGYTTDPSECKGVGTSDSRHECVNPKTPAPTPAPTPRPTPRPTPAPTPSVYFTGQTLTANIMDNKVRCKVMGGKGSDPEFTDKCETGGSYFRFPKRWHYGVYCCEKLGHHAGCDGGKLGSWSQVKNPGHQTLAKWCKSGKCSYSYWSGWWC